jgi:class 3 adenylate cyclase
VGLKDTLLADCAKVHTGSWSGVDARIVPAPPDIPFGKSFKRLERAAVLYADLDGSTAMVERMRWQFSAEVYQSFLNAVAKITKDQGGTITAYDGDRLMAIFIGDEDCSNAVRAAFKIRWAVKYLINPALRTAWTTDFGVCHTVGIDVSPLHAVRTGVRGDNDIVWVGKAANHAAKLTTQSSATPTWISQEVYDRLPAALRMKGENSIWQHWTWNEQQVKSSDWELAIT